MNIKKYLKPILNILIYIFLPYLITLILKKINYPHNNLFLNFYNLIPSLIIFIIIIIYNKDLFKNKLKDFKDNHSKYLSLMIKYYICGFILMMICSTILVFITKNIPKNEVNNREIIKLLPIYSIINVGILGPICEEITFRGSFKDLIKSKKIYLIMTTFIFGLMHVIFSFDLYNIFPYMALGFFLGLVYYETDNIWCSTFIHIFHNFLYILPCG